MNEENQFTIEQFYRHIRQGRLLGARCRKCGKIHLPPRPLCDECFSERFEWTEIPQRGKLLTYTIIDVAPPQFQEMTPYVVGIVQLGNGLRIPGMIKNVDHDKIRIGMELTMEFDQSAVQLEWPQWPRYYFKQA